MNKYNINQKKQVLAVSLDTIYLLNESQYNPNHQRAWLNTNIKPKSILAWPSQFYWFLSHQPAKLIEYRIAKRLN